MNIVFKINNGRYEEVNTEFQAQYTRGVSHLQNWCETIWTSPLNREKKLNQLGI